MATAVRALSLLSALALAACTPAPREPIRLGVLVFPPYELFHLAAESGELPRETARLVSYRSPAEIARAYESGVVDAMTATLEYGLALHRGNDDHRVVLVLDVSHGADALIARPPLVALADLRGRRVGAESGELGSYVLQRALDRAGLRHEEIEIVPVDVADQEEAYLAGRVDALVTYDPVRARLVAAGARELFTSREIPGEIVDVLIVRDELLAARRDDLRRIADAWFAARARFLAAPAEAAERMAPREALSADELLATLAGVRLPDAAENAELLSGRDPALFDSVRRRGDRLVAAGIVDRLPALERLFDPSLVAGAPP
jgi:NitT/TauT family transport system substrate-binding protein